MANLCKRNVNQAAQSEAAKSIAYHTAGMKNRYRFAWLTGNGQTCGGGLPGALGAQIIII